MNRRLRAPMRLALIALIALVALPGARAAAQLAPGEPSLPARLLPPTRAAIAQLADSLRREGLPHDLLATKAAEGVLKQASDERILVAVRALAADLRAARVLLGGAPARGELVAAAAALHAGVTGPTIQRVAAGARQDAATRTTALLVLVDLVAQQVPAAGAADAIGALLARGASERGLLRLRDEVLQDVQRGGSPAEALARVGVSSRPRGP